MKSFKNYMKSALCFSVSSSGKAGKLEFIIYFISGFVLNYYALYLYQTINLNNEKILHFFYVCFIILLTFIPIQSVTTRRLRDVGINPVLIILNFIPFLAVLFKVYLSFAKSKNDND